MVFVFAFGAAEWQKAAQNHAILRSCTLGLIPHNAQYAILNYVIGSAGNKAPEPFQIEVCLPGKTDGC